MNNYSDNLGFDLVKSKKSYKPSKRKKNVEKALVFSKKIIAALEDKILSHSKENGKEIKLFDLKTAYKNGFNNSENLNKETLAHVNLFIRLSKGDLSNIFSNLKSSIFEISGSQFIVKGSLTPSEVDYNQAEQDIIKYDLQDFDFTSAEELYLEDEEDSVTNTFGIFLI